MIEISKDEINGLIRKYLEDEGYFYTLYTFKNEASPSDRPLTQTLVFLINKGLQYLYGYKHLHGNKVIPCKSKFCLSEEHLCSSGDVSDSKRGEASRQTEEYGKDKDRKTSIGLVGNILSNYNEEEIPEMKLDSKNESEGMSSNIIVSKSGMKFDETSLAGVNDSKLACWNGDYLAVYTDTNELFAFHFGNFLWKKEINDLTALSWHNEDLAVGNKNGEIITINILNSRTRNYVCHNGAVTEVRQRGKGILSSGADGRIVVMNNGVNEIAISNNGIAKSIWMTEEEVGCCLDDFSVVFANVETSTISKLGGHKDKITELSYNGSVISTSSHDCTIGLWNILSMNGNCIKAHASEVNDHKWIDDGIVSCGSDGEVKLWDLEKAVPTFKLSHNDKALTVDCSSTLIASGFADGTVIMSDTRCGEVCRYNINNEVFKLLFSQNGSNLCVCSHGVSPRIISLK